MVAINRLNQKTALKDSDIFPIWDTESGRTKGVVASVIKQYVGNIVADGNKYVNGGTFKSGTLTLHFIDGSDLQIRGFTPDLLFSAAGGLTGAYEKVKFSDDFNLSQSPTDPTQIQIAVKQQAPSIGNQFIGIYDEIGDLTDASKSPTPNMQAIVIKPSEKYYHVVAGVWVPLAPVNAFHPTYLGAYDTTQDLDAAQPTPSNGDIAIVGTADKAFYLYDSGQWEPMKHTDLTALNAKVKALSDDVAQVQQKLTTLQNDFKTAVTHVALSGSTLTFTHGDTAKHAIQLPQAGSAAPAAGIATQIKQLESQLSAQGNDIAAIKKQYGTLDHKVTSLDGGFVYSGTDQPTYPTSPKLSYFLNMAGAGSAPVLLSLPDLNLPDGTFVFINNGNTKAPITLRPKSGESIVNADHLSIGVMQFAALVKNRSNWVKIAAGIIPSGYTDLINRVAQNLKSNDELHTTSQITQLVNSWLANPTTQGNLDKIMTSLGYEKKTQPNPHPSTIQIYIGQSDDYPTAFARSNGPFATHQKLVAQGMDKTPSKVWIAVPNEQSSKVTGIVADGGLAALWDSQTETINGKQWRVFLSPYQFHSQHIDFTLNWSI